jgi:hypothetical protein
MTVFNFVYVLRTGFTNTVPRALISLKIESKNKTGFSLIFLNIQIYIPHQSIIILMTYSAQFAEVINHSITSSIIDSQGDLKL